MNEAVDPDKSIVRLVKMTLHPERVDDFLRLFDERSSHIRSFPGCRRLELMSDVRHPNVLTTYSVWDSEAALATYRGSNLFKETWSLTREMFADRPSATSYSRIRRVASGED
jgi:quinol monooxygenase YgiN